MQRLKEKLLASAPIYLLLCFSFLWLWLNRDIYFDPSRTLPRDNLKHHLPMLVYVSDYLRMFKMFPDWLYSYYGGVWLSALSNNFLVLMPHRLLGAYLAANTEIHPNLIFKALLWLGQFLFCFGLYRLSRLLFESVWIRVGALFTALVTAVTLTFTYQEHALGTLFYIPWLWICFIRLRESYEYALPFSAMLGLSLNNHYPQLIAIYLCILAVAALTSIQELKEVLLVRFTQLRKANFKFWFLCGISFLLSASPLFYSYTKYRGDLESPFRLQKDGITSGNYEEYEILNTALSKLHPANFKLYFNFKTFAPVFQTALDESLTYMGPLTAFILFGLVFLKVPLKRFHLFTLLSLAVCACGTYTMAPKIFWNIIPGLTLFRQWIFFLTFLDLQLLYLFFVVGEKFLTWKIDTIKDKRILVGGALGFSFLVAFHWIEPIYGVPAIFLFLGKFWLPPTRAIVLRTVFYCWLVLGSFYGALGYLEHLREFLNEWNASHLFHNFPKKEGDEGFTNLKGAYQQFVALPKAVHGKDYLSLNQKGNLYFATPEGKFSPVASSAMENQLGGFKIKNDPKFKYFVLPQLNDGQWFIKTDGFLPILTPASTAVGTWVKIPSGARYIEFTRRRGIWNYLIGLMWVPLASILGMALYRKLQNARFLLQLSSLIRPGFTIPDKKELHKI